MKKNNKLLFFVVASILLVSCVDKQHQPINTFVVSFNGNGGTLVSGAEVQIVTKASQIIEPSYEKNGYTFVGWDKELSTIASDTTINACWEMRNFTVTWKNYDETILSQETYKFGDIPVYKHENPIRMSDEQYSYKFVGWDKEITAIISDVSYTAKYEQTSHEYKLDYIPTSEITGIDCPAVFKCPICGQKTTRTLNHIDINIPILKLKGDFTGISKSQKVKIEATYESSENTFDADATLKWQGATSIEFPKKNYSIQFFKKGSEYDKKYKVEMFPGWGKESKYCLKANYSDFTSSKNTCLGKIWGDVVRSRKIIPEELSKLPNCGAQDGFPIMIFENNIYQGLYVLTIPKDKWLFGMEDNENNQAILCSGSPESNVCKFLEPTDYSFSKGIELEYCSSNETNWVSNSINNLINFTIKNDGENFKNEISNYLDVESAIDCYLFACAFSGSDNLCNNMIYVTYDGVKWFPSMYDLDFTILFTCYYPTFENELSSNFNLLFKRIFDNYKEESKKRWKQLREGPLSIENIDLKFSDFYNGVLGLLYKSEDIKWDYRFEKKTQNFEQIIHFIKINLSFLDAKFDYSCQNDKGYKIKFNTSDCILYRTAKTDKMETYYNVAYSRDKDDGKLTSSGEGCVYFKIYSNVKITIDGIYDKIETPETTGQQNLYCISGISSNLSVLITTE